MSGRALYRQPTWTGIGPPRLRSRPVPHAAAARIRAAIGPAPAPDGRLVAIRASAGGGLFRLEAPDGSRFYVKVVAPGRCEALAEADAVASWLHAHDIAVPVPCPGYPRETADGNWIFVQPAIEGVRLRASATGMRRLGIEIARMHRALGNHPRRLAWKAATRARVAHLELVRDELASGTRPAGPKPEALAAIAIRRDLGFGDEGHPAVPLHGDLNPGNLLQRRQDGRICFLDFEDVCHSVLPPAFELSLVAQRMVLARVDEDGLAAALMRELYRGYTDHAGAGPPVSLAEAWRYMQALALRSLCVLADAEWTGTQMPRREWDKFFMLYALTERRRGIFDAVA